MVSMNQRELFTFLFEQNPFSSYNFRSEIIEASTIMADILLKRPSIALRIYNLYALKATQWHSLYIIIISLFTHCNKNSGTINGAHLQNPPPLTNRVVTFVAFCYVWRCINT